MGKFLAGLALGLSLFLFTGPNRAPEPGYNPDTGQVTILATAVADEPLTLQYPGVCTCYQVDGPAMTFCPVPADSCDNNARAACEGRHQGYRCY